MNMCRWMSLVVVLFFAGCGSTPELWEERTYDGVRRDDVFGIVKRLLDTDFRLTKVDLVEGLLETRWDEPLIGYRRVSVRRRVLAEVHGGQGAPVIVRLRVPTQVTYTPSPVYALDDDEWEDSDDDTTISRVLITKVDAILGEFGPSDSFTEEHDLGGSPVDQPDT